MTSAYQKAQQILDDAARNAMQPKPLTLSDIMLEAANIAESLSRAVALERKGETESLRTQLQSTQAALEDLSDRVWERIANL